MNDLQHKERHQQLHKALDELSADYIMAYKGKWPSNTSVRELMVWSHEQCEKPNHPSGTDSTVKMTKEKVERLKAVYKVLELARSMQDDPDEDAMVSTALEFGSGMGVTKEECGELLGMSMREFINLEL